MSPFFRRVGRLLASALVIVGYGIIAVPTGIVTAELVSRKRPAPAPRRARRCPACARAGNDADAAHCKHCGAELSPATARPAG